MFLTRRRVAWAVISLAQLGFGVGCASSGGTANGGGAAGETTTAGGSSVSGASNGGAGPSAGAPGAGSSGAAPSTQYRAELSACCDSLIDTVSGPFKTNCLNAQSETGNTEDGASSVLDLYCREPHRSCADLAECCKGQMGAFKIGCASDMMYSLSNEAVCNYDWYANWADFCQ